MKQVKKWAAAHNPDSAASIKGLPDELFCNLYKEYYDLGPQPEKTKDLITVFEKAAVLFKEFEVLSYEHQQLRRSLGALLTSCRPVTATNLAKVVTSIYGSTETFRGVYAINAFRLETTMDLTRSYKLLLDSALGREANIYSLTLGFIYVSIVDEQSGTEVTCPEIMKAEIREAYYGFVEMVTQLSLQRA